MMDPVTWPRNVSFAMAALLLAYWTGGCGDTEPPPPAPRPTTVTVSPASVRLAALETTVQLVAEVRDQYGQVMTGAAVTWTSGDATVASVDGSGLVTAVGEGVATIAATAGDAQGTSEITVSDPDNPDRAVLVALYEATDGPNWVDSRNWLTDAPLREWYGVETDGSGRVVQLDLGGRWDGEAQTYVPHGLSGPIPPELGSLANLTRLHLAGNELTGPIPPELGNLGNLAGLSLNANSLTGSIPPELGNLGNLTWLHLGGNTLSGPIPPELGALGSLTGLNLSANSLTGPIPPELGTLGSLSALSLNDNELRGPIPPELCVYETLSVLSLNDNELTGPFPRDMGTLASLSALNLSDNELTGPIPPEVGTLASLSVLNLNGNDLSGPIPPELRNLANLTWLDLAGNTLSGPIPPELGGLVKLRRLDLGENALSGPIPQELASFGNLTGLYLEDNSLSGPVPPELGNLANLRWLNFRSNRLTGPLPHSFLLLDRLERLYASANDLCVPGISAFSAWLKGIRSRDFAVFTPCNAADIAALEALYAAAGGDGWIDSDGWLSDRDLEEWHGVTMDSIGRVTELDLASNGLAGHLPYLMDGLARMTVLRLGDNALSGRLPLALTRLALSEFRYAGTDLCAPSEESFQEWLDGVSSHEGTGIECAPLSDRDVLEALYNSAGGPNWARNDNWLTDAPLGEWEGVTVDSENHVVGLDLRQNRLTDRIPPEIGSLASLAVLTLSGNDLTSRIPPELGSLAKLTELHLGWNQLTGPIPPELGSLGKLTWLELPGNSLSGPIPRELGGLVELKRLYLEDNELTGPIPPELGALANLTWLELSRNRLTGPIPRELGSLPGLVVLDLGDNALKGPIPAELGNLARLGWLFLWGNNLTGPIPGELGSLARVTRLSLSDNELSGVIPGELGGLARVTSLGLDGNALSGPLPPRLGELSRLEALLLNNNELTGSVPPEFGGMASLRELSVANNTAMSGALPADLTGLHELEALIAGGTDLCAPTDGDFKTWLEGIARRRIRHCAEGLPAAYLTQAVQSREFPVPLVAGERALLRVFVTAGETTREGIPRVVARFHVDGRETHVEDIPGKSDPIPTEVDESRLWKSANAEIPAHVIQPGLEMVVEVDPDGTLNPDLGVPRRIPASGRLAVEVRDMPTFDLTVIPFVWTETHDSSIVDLVEAMAADPENHEMLEDTRTLLPIGELDVTAHEPVLSSTNNGIVLLFRTGAIRAMEGGTGHYMGMMVPPVRLVGGASFGPPARSSFSQPYPYIVAHELGHNISLYHAPCGDPAGLDSNFPHSDGSTGAWGYDLRDGGSLVRPSTADLMSYCRPSWMSDYHFTNALRFRLSDADSVGLPRVSGPRRSLLLWGGVGADGVPFLEPAFVVDAPSALPQTGGAYRLTGSTAGGAELFSLRFDMRQVADGDGSSGFAFVLPVESGWEGALSSITLSGPGGSVTLDGDSDRSMAILRDPRTGRIRGILSDLPATVLTRMDAVAALAADRRFDVLFSRGIPDAEAWRR